MDSYQGTNNSGLFVDQKNLNSSQLFQGYSGNRDMQDWGPTQSQGPMHNYTQGQQEFRDPTEIQQRDINTNYSNLTHDRRQYPKNIIGAKSEWRGLEKHQQEVNYELQKLQGDINQLKQKDLLTELDRKMLMKHELRKEELLQKSKETDIFQIRQKQYEDSLKQMQEDQEYVQQNLAVQYDTQMKGAVERDIMQREKIKILESEQNEKARRLLESQQRKRRILRDHEKSEFQKNINLFEERKRKEKMDRENEQMQYNEMVKYNNIKDQIKEENYKNFFKSVVKNQDHIQKHHIDHVLGPLLDRERMLEQAFTSKSNSVQARAIQMELNKIRAKKDDLLRSRDTNQMLIAEHEQRQDLEKMEKQNEAQRRLEDQLKYKELDQFQRKLQEDQKLQYQDFLEKQNRENEELKMNNQRMTRNEQVLNYVDLQAFKTNDPGLYSMLPGWSPQIGQLPPKQNREMMQQRVMNQLKKQHEIDPNLQSTQSELMLLDKGTSGVGFKESLFSNVGKNSLTPSLSVGQFKPFQKIGEPMERYENDLNRGGKLDYSQHTRGNSHQYLQSIPNHNPITNALNMNYYNNPYIRKDIMRGSNQSKQQGYNMNGSSSATGVGTHLPGINRFNPFHENSNNTSNLNLKEQFNHQEDRRYASGLPVSSLPENVNKTII